MAPPQRVVGSPKIAPRHLRRHELRRARVDEPNASVQRLCIEDAQRRREHTDSPVEEISFRVGYEDAALFRRLFRRTTGLAPGAYRKRFQVPDFAKKPI
jgi:transcriptional regulator GlxA family with amidase domain